MMTRSTYRDHMNTRPVFDLSPSDVAALADTARSQGISEILVEVLTDTMARDVVRLRALSRILIRMAGATHQTAA